MTWYWSERRARVAILALLATAVAGAVALAAIEPSQAQINPFGAPRPSAVSPPESGIVGWLLAKQGEFFRQFSKLIRAAKADGSAIWTLVGVSFAYGVFHAAGPGHGKAVISSYLVANEETWRRGIVLSFASAFLQALVAVALVAIAAAALQATARDMNNAVRVIEIAGYALIALMGAQLTWVKGRGLLQAVLARNSILAGRAHQHRDCGAGSGPHSAHDAHHSKRAGHDHGPDAHCEHCHGPRPQDLIGPGGWRRGLTAIVAVGLRPCSGAILVLVFALAQGLFWAGIVSTLVMGLGTAITVAVIATLTVAAKGIAARLAERRSGSSGSALALRAIETGASVLVLAFGVALLLGYMATERMIAI